LNGAIGEGEQHTVLGRLMPDFLPARTTKMSRFLPIDDEVVADMRATAAFDGREYGGIGRTVGSSRKALRQKSCTNVPIVAIA